MTVASEIQRIKNNVAAAYAAAENKGAIMPATRNSNNLSTTISTIEAHAEPVLQDKTVIYNGEYTADEGYDGLREVTVDVASTGSTIPAVNYTGEAINAGDKVWVNKYVYESGSSVNLSRQATRVMPDFNFYVNGTNLYRVSDNIQVGTFNNSVGGYHMNYANGLTVTSSTYYRNGVTSYYRNGIVIANFGSTTPIAGRPDLIVQSNTLKKINPETGEILASYTGSVKTYDDYASASSNVMIGSYIYTYYGIYLIDDENLTVTAINQNGNPFYYPGCIPIIGFTSDGKYMITGNNNGSSYGKVWRINGNSATNVNTTFPDIGNLDTYNYIFYQSTNLLAPKNTANLATNPVYQYNPATETWDAVPVNASGLQDTKVQFNPEMTKYATGNSPYRVINLVATIGTYLYPYAQMNMSSNTVTGTAAENISVGATGNVYLGDKGNLQSKIALSNGTIRPDSDYYGLKSVTVNVVGTGAEVEGKNYTGAVINEGDKVWINPTYTEEGTVQEYFNSQNDSSCFTVIRLNENYTFDFWKGRLWNNGVLVGTAQSSCYNINSYNTNGYHPVFAPDGVVYIYNGSGMQRIDSGLSWYKTSYSLPIFGTSEYIIDKNNSAIVKIDPSTGNEIKRYTTDYTNVFGSCISAIYYGNGKFSMKVSGQTSGWWLCTLDEATNTFSHTTKSYLSSLTEAPIGITSDYKYVICGDNHVYDVSNIENGITDVYTSKNFPAQIALYQNGLYFNGQTDMFCGCGTSSNGAISISDTNKPEVVYYNKVDESFTKLPLVINSAYSGYYFSGACISDGELVCYSVAKNGWGQYVYSPYLTTITGNNLVPFSQIFADTQTGIATKSIATGGTGTVKVGAAIIPEGSTTITENGTYDVTDYAEAVVNVPTGAGNVYSLETARELTDDLYHSSVIKAGLETVDILGGDASLTPLRDTWEYRPTLAEYYQDILTNDHLYTEQKLTEILGEESA